MGKTVKSKSQVFDFCIRVAGGEHLLDSWIDVQILAKIIAVKQQEREKLSASTLSLLHSLLHLWQHHYKVWNLLIKE